MTDTISTYNSTAFTKAKSLVDKNSLVKILSALVDVASPTGEEAPLAQRIVEILNDFDLEGQEQVIDPLQSNAVGIIKGTKSSDNESLMF